MKLSIVYYRDQKELVGEVEDFFIASNNPLYLGLIIKPSTGVWEILKSSSHANVRVNGEKILEFEIPYKIEVGENTIFFARPSEGYEKTASETFIKS